MSNKFKEIIKQGYFLSVGGYKTINPKFKIHLNEKTGMYEPDNNFIDDEYLDLCPSYKIDYNDLSKKIFGQHPNTNLGQTEATFLGQSTNYERNYKATSGAIVKETLRHLFTEKKIDAAIVIKKVGPLKYKPCKITSIKEVDSLPPSVYHMIDYTDTVKILEESEEKNIVVVGTPWQIDGLYLYIYNHNPKLKEKVYLTIGLLSGWYFSYHMIKALCTYYRIDYNELDDIIYRGNGKSGKTKFILKDGTEKVINRFTIKSLVAFERFFNVPKFLIEINTHNMLADMVVGDSHIPECSFSKTGISLIIARSRKTIDLLRKMERSDLIKLLKIDDNVLVKSQKRERLYGDFAYSYMEYLQSIGKIVPEIVAPNKSGAIFVNRKKVEKFHKDYKHKRKLQQNGKYWQIFIEKYTINGMSIYPRLIKQIFGKLKSRIKNKSLNSKSKIALNIEKKFV